MQLNLFSITEISYKERLISLSSRMLLARAPSSIVPIVHESAKTTQASATLFSFFVPKRCRSKTYQNLFLIRIWNLLTGRMNLANATLTSFKSFLHDYYHRAVRLNHNLDNRRTFKTICLKYNSTIFLDVPIMCCM